eukprot:TRINITY_DN324_c0_g1_i1.p1 TRINITY_DN324_c0_g1~~TRINITY_DN324_c0_g1_i1.p1  ORF type:complete len:604 (+),score=131.61 TRINITY_DN324_c0_g1_i1:131-1942(+)
MDPQQPVVMTMEMLQYLLSAVRGSTNNAAPAPATSAAQSPATIVHAVQHAATAPGHVNVGAPPREEDDDDEPPQPPRNSVIGQTRKKEDDDELSPPPSPNSMIDGDDVRHVVKRQRVSNSCSSSSSSSSSSSGVRVRTPSTSAQLRRPSSGLTARDTRLVAFFCDMGGTTKTTTTVWMAQQLVHKGKSVLIVDCDPRSDILTKFVPPPLYDRIDTSDVEEFLTEDDVKQLEVFRSEGVDIIRGLRSDQKIRHPELLQLATLLPVNDETFDECASVLSSFIKRLRKRCTGYDYVLFDMDTVLSDNINQSVIMSMDTILFLCPPEPRSFSSLKRLLGHLSEVSIHFYDHRTIRPPAVGVWTTKIKTIDASPDKSALAMRAQTQYAKFIQDMTCFCVTKNEECSYVTVKFGGFMPLLDVPRVHRSLIQMKDDMAQNSSAKKRIADVKVMEYALQMATRFVDRPRQYMESDLEASSQNSISVLVHNETVEHIMNISHKHHQYTPPVGCDILMWIKLPPYKGGKVCYRFGKHGTRTIAQRLRRMNIREGVVSCVMAPTSVVNLLQQRIAWACRGASLGHGGNVYADDSTTRIIADIMGSPADLASLLW